MTHFLLIQKLFEQTEKNILLSTVDTQPSLLDKDDIKSYYSQQKKFKNCK